MTMTLIVRYVAYSREAFKRATTIYVYILTEGKKAQAEITMTIQTTNEEEVVETITNTLSATARYGGSRGNALAVTIDTNPLGGYDVLIHLDGNKVVEYEGLNTIEELIALDNPYISFLVERVNLER